MLGSAKISEAGFCKTKRPDSSAIAVSENFKALLTFADVYHDVVFAAAQAASCMTRHITFPLPLFGMASTKRTLRGAL
jgi:hypothetical protein